MLCRDSNPNSDTVFPECVILKTPIQIICYSLIHTKQGTQTRRFNLSVVRFCTSSSRGLPANSNLDHETSSRTLTSGQLLVEETSWFVSYLGPQFRSSPFMWQHSKDNIIHLHCHPIFQSNDIPTWRYTEKIMLKLYETLANYQKTYMPAFRISFVILQIWSFMLYNRGTAFVLKSKVYSMSLVAKWQFLYMYYFF